MCLGPVLSDVMNGREISVVGVCESSCLACSGGGCGGAEFDKKLLGGSRVAVELEPPPPARGGGGADVGGAWWLGW